MKSLGALLFACLAAASAAAPAESGREEVPLTSGWRFHPGDEADASQARFDDSSWQAVDLPHTWNGLDGEDGGNNYRRGAGWYRRHLPVGRSLAGRRLYLQFDGASLKADVFVNGVQIVRDGDHTGAIPGQVLRSGRDTHTVALEALRDPVAA